MAASWSLNPDEKSQGSRRSANSVRAAQAPIRTGPTVTPKMATATKASPPAA